ncbi:PaaI family thioesterase [Pseudocolwellia agarivorans]|uniref:PaaI family thioesterase n=1 Tax=Pseudocolwellia agarivorans TaxID=1911682 RepID=UPI000987BFF9|nr:PaaI family thioesterase [Pseudocolwellia agarivorans]
MTTLAFQDFYPDEISHCYGCGKNNPEGHQLKSYWFEDTNHLDGKCLKTIAHFTPDVKYTAIPGFVYGGLIASLIDCHGTGSAAAMAYHNEKRPMDSSPALRFVTGALNVSYLAPTPQNKELTLIGTFTEIKARKIIVNISLLADNVECARGEVIAVLMPDSMLPKSS